MRLYIDTPTRAHTAFCISDAISHWFFSVNCAATICSFFFFARLSAPFRRFQQVAVSDPNGQREPNAVILCGEPLVVNYSIGLERPHHTGDRVALYREGNLYGDAAVCVLDRLLEIPAGNVGSVVLDGIRLPSPRTRRPLARNAAHAVSEHEDSLSVDKRSASSTGLTFKCACLLNGFPDSMFHCWPCSRAIVAALCLSRKRSCADIWNAVGTDALECTWRNITWASWEGECWQPASLSRRG